MARTLREHWDGTEATIGGWCSIPSAFSAELMGRSGFDWVCVDTQHGLIGYDQLVPMLQALSITATPAFVRVPWNQPDHIMKALDAGAQGVIVPMVSSADEARAAVAAVKYPPMGMRSWGPIRAALDVEGYSPELANRRTVVAVMIETPGGVENLDAILAVPGVDAVYVGPSDLALGHGMTPTLNVTDPEHEALIETVIEGCRRAGIVAGIHCDSVETVRRWHARGYGMFTVGSDAALMRQAATTVVAQAFEGSRDVVLPSTGQYA
ncbi:HpcH/HpaI aldolase/citrate lyase family protein [Pseudonocardia sp. MH-G8]|uniref:HpcH/HpaI aldolase family protein n=1 Tax=Pseudonocardia sp. MH-G8 TaxID=1854588 RepID=UPI000BA14E99|nr:aldolase/citrate lyase family protein [Pseudonocardia sp. MH-G8]OZM81319.1 2,4-dihydroxyhept-2-ene-1,7-dioic acid aldolase [Pseudonocardia sp. MH-G8]